MTNPDRCIQQGVESMATHKFRTICSLQMCFSGSYLRDNRLKLLNPDKDAGFVEAPAAMYKAHGDCAFMKYFNVANKYRWKKYKRSPTNSIDVGLSKLAKDIGNCREGVFNYIFSAKTQCPRPHFGYRVKKACGMRWFPRTFAARNLNSISVICFSQEIRYLWFSF